MRAVVRSFISFDVDFDSFEPIDPNNFGFGLRMLVGPAVGPGEESFDLVVCSATWLGQAAQDRGPQLGRHHLIVDRFARTEVESFLREAVANLEGRSWHEIAEKVGRIGCWEFEDYEPNPGE